MTKTSVLLQGFYGYANFGDDVLMVVTHRIMRCALPDAEMTIMTDASDARYVAQMLPDVKVEPMNPRARFSMIIHGGGGVFFDFASYGWWQRCCEHLLLAAGLRNYLLAESIARWLLRRPRISAPRRLGLGIGVGSFSAGSLVLRKRLHMLAQFDALWLRDAQSDAQLQRFASIMHDERILGSDLAFLTEYWLPQMPPARVPSPSPRLGIALRDWAGISPEMLTQIIANLAQEYDISGFVLDEVQDPMICGVLAPYPTHIWQPDQMHIADFMAHLGAMDVLLTSRAHAAICGACVGVPSVIVNIEPKMEQVHAMLPQASQLVAQDDANAWPAAIRQMAKVSSADIASDVARNRAASHAALAAIDRWFV